MAPPRARRVLVTAGPTREAIDPVRYLSNESSGRMGFELAAAAARAGARGTLVAGPVHQETPAGVRRIDVVSAREMLAATTEAFRDTDALFMCAAVADWRPRRKRAGKWRKEGEFKEVATLELVRNPDILATLAAAGNRRPRLVVGFAAETTRVIEHAAAKLKTKGCDWILANDVSTATGTCGGDDNTIHLVDAGGVEDWPRMSKTDVAMRLARRIAGVLESPAEAAE